MTVGLKKIIRSGALIMKLKRTLSILTLPFTCLLSSCKEEPLVYGTKSIYERPTNYQGLYWLGDKVDINDDSLYMLTTRDDETGLCNYSRLFTESKYVYECGIAPTEYSIYDFGFAFPSVVYKITKGHNLAETNCGYFVTSICVISPDIKSLYGVDITTSAKEKERKFAEYNFGRYSVSGFENENSFIHIRYLFQLTINTRSLNINYRIPEDYYYNRYEEGYDSSLFTDEKDQGINIRFINNSWFKKDNY